MWRAIESVHRRRLDAWGARWVLSVLSARGLSVLPGVNLVSNTGHGRDATHTTVASHLADRPLGSLPAMLHGGGGAAALAPDPEYDEDALAEMNRKGPWVARIAARIVAGVRPVRG